MKYKYRKISLYIVGVYLAVFFLGVGVCLADNLDSDGDGLSDSDEINIYFTSPYNIDTDGDGYNDGDEIKNNYSPLVEKSKLAEVDTDNDGLNDALEIALGTVLSNADTDSDDYLDGAEVYNGFSPFKGGGDRGVDRHVEVDLTTQKFYYFFNGVKLGEILTSTGRPAVPTPNGEFKILRKVPVKTYRTVTGGSYPNTKWNLLFESKTGLYLHGAYWHNDFGVRPRSGGCVNLAYPDAEKMYQFLDVGDKIKIYGKTPKGKVVLAGD